MPSSLLRLRFIIDGQERLYPLVAERVRLGRGGDNDVVLSDVSVSRNHAEIRRGPEGFSVHDLRSTNGVEINRVAVEAAPLHDGDRITIGAFELLVEAVEPPPERKSFEPLAATGGLAGLGNATIVRPLAEIAAALDRGEMEVPEPKPGDSRDPVYANRMLAFLTRLARVLLAAETVDEVLLRMLDIAFEALPVDRGFILLADDAGELVCELARFKERVELRPTDEVPVSRTMLRSVIAERVALVTFDAQSDQRLLGGESIRLHQIRAAMCAPLWSGDRIIGVVQVDSPFQVGAFGQRDLDFLSTLANYVAVAVERLRYAAKAEFERQVRSRLERYHSPALIEEVLRQGEAGEGEEELRRLKTAEATVLFADLVGFTAFAENSRPEHVAELLNAFLNLSV
ncbi:MAG TPA: FHA domain-containing protein, partial [Thermoanaerobaculia bacterium]